MFNPCSHHIRVTLLSCLLLLLLPVVAQANWLGGIEFTQPTLSHMPLNERVYVSVDYKVTHPDGARIYVIPYSEGAPCPAYGVSGSPIYTGEGTTTNRYFTIVSGTELIDQVRVYMVNPDQSEVLLELFVRVFYHYGPSGIYNIQYSEAPYAHLHRQQDLVINFDYATTEASNLRIWARPFTNGALTPGYSASGSILLPPSGSSNQTFHFPATDADITHVRFRMVDDDTGDELLVFLTPIKLFWRQVGITNITFDWPQPAALHHNDDVTVSFDYNNTQNYDIRVWFQAYNDGGYAPGSHYQGSVALPPGISSATRTFGVHTGETDIDASRLIVTDADQNITLIDNQIPVRYHGGPHAVHGVQLWPERTAMLDHTEVLDIAFDYETSYNEQILIFARPFYQGGLAGGYYASGSPYYAPGTGSGSGYIGYDYGTHAVDQIRFQVKNLDQSEILFTWYYPARHFWGPSATMVPVPDALPQLTMLGQNYPNPYNPVTTIPVTVQHTGRVRINAYDIRGRMVQVIADEIMAAGHHEITFNGSDLPSGTYFYRLEGTNIVDTKRMTLVK